MTLWYTHALAFLLGFMTFGQLVAWQERRRKMRSDRAWRLRDARRRLGAEDDE